MTSARWSGPTSLRNDDSQCPSQDRDPPCDVLTGPPGTSGLPLHSHNHGYILKKHHADPPQYTCPSSSKLSASQKIWEGKSIVPAHRSRSSYDKLSVLWDLEAQLKRQTPGKCYKGGFSLIIMHKYWFINCIKCRKATKGGNNRGI